MELKVKGRDMVEILSAFVGNTKTMFNFMYTNDILEIQILEDYTVVTKIDCELVAGPVMNEDVSFWVTNAVLTMIPNYDIIINITDMYCEFKQGINSCRFNREYESRREFPDTNDIELKPAFADRLKYLTHSAVTCNPLAKELSISYPDPQFSNGKFYLDYKQTFFIENMLYPEMCIPISSLRAVAFKLSKEAKYSYLKQYSTLLFISDKYQFWVPTNNYNLEGNRINAVDQVLTDCKEFTTLTIKEYIGQINTIVTAFPKHNITLSFGDGLFRIAVNSNNAQVIIGNLIDRPIVSIEVTSAQLGVISKLFKDDEDISIKRGANCICLNKNEKNLLISNLLF